METSANKGKIMRKYILTIFAIIVVLSADSALAQNKESAKNINVLHTPIKATELPFPGGDLLISATLENTRNSQLVLKGFFVKDGKVVEQNLEDFSTNDREQLVYATKIPAPLAELNYQFVLLDKGQVIATTKRFSVRRNCIPNIAGMKLGMPEDSNMKDRVKVLQLQATSIQEEVQNYEKSITLLEELKSLTDK